MTEPGPITSPQAWLEARAPKATAEQARAAAIALLETEEREAEFEALEALDELTRILADRAYRAGVRDALAAITGLIGAPAVTLDAAVLRARLDLSATSRVLDFEPARRLPDGGRWTTPAHVRAAGLVAEAHRALEARRGGGDPT